MPLDEPRFSGIWDRYLKGIIAGWHQGPKRFLFGCTKLCGNWKMVAISSPHQWWCQNNPTTCSSAPFGPKNKLRSATASIGFSWLKRHLVERNMFKKNITGMYIIYNLLLEHEKSIYIYAWVYICIFEILERTPMTYAYISPLHPLSLAWSSGCPKRRFLTFYGWFFRPFALETTTTLVKKSPSSRSCWWSSNPLVGNSSWQSVINWHSQHNSNLNKFPSFSSQLYAWHR